MTREVGPIHDLREIGALDPAVRRQRLREMSEMTTHGHGEQAEWTALVNSLTNFDGECVHCRVYLANGRCGCDPAGGA